MPHVIVQVTEAGTLEVTVDGETVPPKGEREAWTRASFGELIDTVTHSRAIPIRIEVHESDGSVFTDIIQSVRRPHPAVKTQEPAKQPAAEPVQSKADRKLAAVRGVGFVDGEQVSIAVVTREATCSASGVVEATVPRSRLHGARQVILYGQESGRTQIQDVR